MEVEGWKSLLRKVGFKVASRCGWVELGPIEACQGEELERKSLDRVEGWAGEEGKAPGAGACMLMFFFVQ